MCGHSHMQSDQVIKIEICDGYNYGMCDSTMRRWAVEWKVASSNPAVGLFSFLIFFLLSFSPLPVVSRRKVKLSKRRETQLIDMYNIVITKTELSKCRLGTITMNDNYWQEIQ